MNLHPGVRIALARLTMDELGIARAMAARELASPQRYENVSLFAMRITGTGTAYRKALDEYVYRRPENYLSPEFLARCNGLPVIFEHPEKATLTSKEYADRNVGSIFLPYFQGDEVWGIAKIYDDDAINLMEDEQLSTSPSVVFRELSVNTKMTLDDGSTLLIEGKPSLLDHLAICERGVWDKGGEPTGVDSGITRGDSDVTEEEKKAAAAEKEKADAARKDADEKEAKEKADRAKADADAGQKLDKLLACIDSMTKRMDAYDEADKARKDAAEGGAQATDPVAVAADKARKDAAEKEEREKADRAKADADIAKRVADAVKEQMASKTMSDADFAAMADAQARADSVFQAFGDKAPRPLDGETLLSYRQRLAGKLKSHSATWKDIDMVSLPEAAFGIAETKIYADAEQVGLHPTDVPAGQLREVTRTDPMTGQRMTTFHGPGTFIGALKRPSRRVTQFNLRKEA